MEYARMGRIKLHNLLLLLFVCLLNGKSSNNAFADKLGHVESLSLKESVIRNNNGVMVMTLSPRRKTMLSLTRNDKGAILTAGADRADGKTVRHNPKPGIIFAARPKSLHGVPHRNQTETETNPYLNFINIGSSSSSVQNHEESHQQSLEDNNDASDFDNENESPLSQSALRNLSIDNEKSRKLEIGQVWSSSSKEDNNNKSTEEDLQTMIAGFLKRELWTIPLFVFASLNIFLIMLFEIYVLCRTKGQSRGHLFLGQMLLFGLFLSSTLALLFSIYPTMFICFVLRIGIGLSYTLIFSVLMVKSMFLLCLDIGIYLPTLYQGCLLFFAVLVQLTLDVQWTILYPPSFQEMESIKEDSVFLQCGTSYSFLVYNSMWYIAFLILLGGFLAAKATFKGITENYRESIYILISIIVSVPIMISWILAGWILEGRQQDACVAFGMVAQSLTIFLIMFMPKGRQLAAMGKELAYEEDDQFSRYSPSFFHFKPSNKGCKAAVFGDGNVYTTLEPTLSTINPNVFFHRGEYHSGMIY